MPVNEDFLRDMERKQLSIDNVNLRSQVASLKAGSAELPPEAMKCVVTESGPTCAGVLVPSPTWTA